MHFLTPDFSFVAKGCYLACHRDGDDATTLAPVTLMNATEFRSVSLTGPVGKMTPNSSGMYKMC